MSFLDRISLIRTLTNGTDYSKIGGSEGQKYFTFEEPMSRFVFITDLELSKTILLSSKFESLNHLNGFIKEEDKNHLKYILLFLQLSPEFGSNSNHKRKSVLTKNIIKEFHSACKKVNKGSLLRHVKKKVSINAPSSALEASKIYLSSYLTLAGKLYYKNENFIFKEDHITEKYGFFSSMPRIVRLKEFNKDIKDHIAECNLNDASEENIYLLLLLRIMGSAPLNSTITSSINSMINEHTHSRSLDLSTFKEDSPFNSFLPTRFVLRRATKPINLENLQLQEDDIIFIYLASTNKCPLKNMRNLPFGYGAHFCPGQKTSETIVKTIIDMIIENKFYVNLRKSEIDNQNASAFLSFKENIN